MIRVQKEDIDVGAEINALTAGKTGIGGLAVFVGVVRDTADGEAVRAMTLEHYPGMTEKKLAEIDAEAQRRWRLEATLVVHRVGELKPGERIVLVAAASAHRDDAFEACRFLIDWLKTQAPFWKLEDKGAKGEWVAARESDADSAARWKTDKGG